MALSKMEFERKVDSQLRKFADGLKAGEEYHQDGIQRCQKVLKALLQATKTQPFSVASTHYGGSNGKGTDLDSSDFDMVLKINDREPPFKDVLEFILLTLKHHAAELQIDPKTFKLTPYSVQFSFDNGMDVDLLPASAKLTEAEAIKKMKGSYKNRRYYSSCLVEEQVAFMKKQNAFAHAVARLAKYWYKSMNNLQGHYVSGGSTIFELLAVAAAMEEGGQGRESMWSAFKCVVQKLENLDRLQLAFEEVPIGSWKIKATLVQGQSTPYLVEPTNPNNNLLVGIMRDAAIVNALKENAKIMKDRLQVLLEKRGYCEVTQVGGETELKVDLDKLFAL